jgi:hypothetical protein
MRSGWWIRRKEEVLHREAGEVDWREAPRRRGRRYASRPAYKRFKAADSSSRVRCFCARLSFLRQLLGKLTNYSPPI